MPEFYVAVILLSALIAMPVAYFVIYEPIYFIKRWYYYHFKCGLEINDQTYLAHHCTFYAGLDSLNKLRFEKRVAFLIRYKQIVGADIEVTREMQLLIMAGFVQVTFGLRRFRMGMFEKITVHKDPYLLPHSMLKARGHVSERGLIHLVWRYVEEGYNDPKDGVNLDIHEAAHAEIVSAIIEGDDIDFSCRHVDWIVVANQELARLQSGEDHFFRKYGATNADEFFAVAIENFFERPTEFKNAVPDLYNATCKLLNLDPTMTDSPILGGENKTTIDIPIEAKPRLGPAELFHLVTESPGHITYFIVGTLAWCYLVNFIYMMTTETVDTNILGMIHPGILSVLCPVSAVIGCVCYIMVFYIEKQDNAPSEPKKA